MDFNLNEIKNHISQVLERYDKKEIRATQTADIMLLDFEKIAEYYNEHLDDLSEKERMDIKITAYAINETIIKIFTELNQEMDEKTGGFLSGRRDVLTFEFFPWEKED